MNADFKKQDIRYLKGVGESREKLFLRLGVDSVGALLHYYPRRYLDLRESYSVGAAPLDTPVVVRATVFRKHAPLRISGGRTIYKIEAGDDSAELTLTYFNNRFTPQALKENESYLFYGQLKGALLSREMVNPQLMKLEETDGLLPQYPATEGLSSRVIANTVRNALEQFGDAIAETLPAEILAQYDLIGRKDAIHWIHFPKDFEQAERARNRLIFEELFTLQLGMLLFRERSKQHTDIRVKTNDPKAFVQSLPFEITGAQRRSIDEIMEDIDRDVPMSRLLQGDVGSGKTVVAAAAVCAAARSGYQSAVMVPTEILAAQHADSFSKLLEGFGITVGFLTGAVKGKARKVLLGKIAGGEVDVVVGTHALIGDGVEFHNLGLVVADEQHRFGVEQRMRLSQKGDNPHLLVMSATPIPRTLALIIYGDLDISVIDELPPGRKPVKTYLVTDAYRERYLNFVKKAVDGGNQAYVVCPLVEESEAVGDPSGRGADDRQAATQYKEELEETYLKGYAIGLVHGRMNPKEKQKVMEAFKSGEISILVSTTVIEVGVDVPNANVMIIENAEVFGLSALHQLRGRIGRGADESYCILVSESRSENAQQRLKMMTESNDGFAIAKFDLALRGPGDLLGKRQHGLPELALADLVSDDRVLYDAQQAAKDLFAEDEGLLKHPAIRNEIERMFEQSEGMYN